MNIYLTQGGIGKTIAFTSILDKIQESICISTYYPEIFKNISKIDTIYPPLTIGDDYSNIFFKNFNEVIYHDPYHGNFLKGQTHLIEAFHEKYNLVCDELYHNIKIEDIESKKYSEMIDQLDSFVLVQFTGSDIDNNINIDVLGTRNLRLKTSQEIINILHNDFKINVLEVNNGQRQFENTVIINNRTLNYRDYLNLMRYCKSFISIDSCLNHMSAFKQKPKKGVCLFRSKEYAKLWEYPHNINLYSEIPLQMKFSTQTIVDQLSTLL